MASRGTVTARSVPSTVPRDQKSKNLTISTNTVANAAKRETRAALRSGSDGDSTRIVLIPLKKSADEVSMMVENTFDWIPFAGYSYLV